MEWVGFFTNPASTSLHAAQPEDPVRMPMMLYYCVIFLILR